MVHYTSRIAPFDGRRRGWRASKKPRQSQDPFLAACSDVLVLFIPRACSPQSIRLLSGSFFARNLRYADRFRVYVNPLEITSSKRRRTVIPLPQGESATALKGAAFICGGSRLAVVTILQRLFAILNRDEKDRERNREREREENGSGFAH